LVDASQAPLGRLLSDVCSVRSFLDRFAVQDRVDGDEALAHPLAALGSKGGFKLVLAGTQGGQVQRRFRQCLTIRKGNIEYYAWRH
jgi:hypothetical protein